MKLGHRIIILGSTAVLLVAGMGGAALLGASRGEVFRSQTLMDREQLEALFLTALNARELQLAIGAGEGLDARTTAAIRADLETYRAHAGEELDEEERRAELRLGAEIDSALSEAVSAPPGAPQARQAISRLIEHVETALAREQREMHAVVLGTSDLIVWMRNAGVTIPSVALVLIAGLSLGLLLPLRRRVRDLLDGAERFARGDATAEIPEDGRDELSRVAAAWNEMHRELRRTTVSRAELEEHLVALHQAREQLVVADRMALVGTLAAGVAHEINNPLAYLSANLDWIRARLSLVEDTPAEMLLAIEEATDGALRIGAIVGDLRTFSRDDDTRVEVDLREVVEDAIRLGGHEIQEVAQLIAILDEVPPVLGNRMRLGQVVLNLLVNAAQSFAGRDDRSIVVRTLADATGRALIVVEDDGPGVPEALRHRIFDPFFTTKPVGVGTGLGLSVCSGIITAHGGSLVHEARPGGGSIFRVRLEPIADHTGRKLDQR